MKKPRTTDPTRRSPGISRRTALKGLSGTVGAGLAWHACSVGLAGDTAFPGGEIPTREALIGADHLAPKRQLVGDARFIDAGRYGAVGDGVTAASAALQAAIAEAGATKRPLWIAPGTYVVDVGLVGVDDLTVFGYGATLLLTDAEMYTPVLGLTHVQNIRLFGLTIDGNRDAFAVDTEWKHALGLFAATNVTIEDCLLKQAKGDGLYIGPPDSGPRVPSQDVVVRGVRMEGNYRQGCSITGARRATFVACRFADTGGTEPQCGVDVEPDSDEDVTQDLTFWSCAFSSNASAGIKVSLRKTPVVPQRNIRFIGCDIGDNQRAGVELAIATGVRFHVCDIHDSGTNGVEIGADNQDDIVFLGGSISDNGQHGISLDAGGMVVTRFKALGVAVENNGASGNASGNERYDGILVADGTFTDILIEGCTITGRGHRYGVHTATDEHETAIERLRIVSNDLTGNATAGARLEVETETQHVAHNFGDIV